MGIKIKAQIGVVATLQQQLVATKFQGFLNLFTIGGHIRNIGVGMPGDPVKITKLTVGNTYIGGIHIAVYLPGNFIIGYLYFAHFISHIHQFGKGGMFKQKHPFFYAQEFKL